ncbi:MAG: NTP transferase domain-containing protein [Ilumatobacteraceae bacterium]
MPHHPSTVVCVVLAAGAGSRFRGDRHKLLVDIDGEPLVVRAVAHALEAGVGDVVVVSGATDVPIDPSDARWAGRVSVMANERWAEGQASSLRAGVAVADAVGADAVVVGLGDQPGVTSAAWRAVATAPADQPVVVASYDGRRGPHPVRLHRSVWPMLSDTGDDGARTLMRDHPTLVHEVPCPGTAADIDTLEDVQRWRSS